MFLESPSGGFKVVYEYANRLQRRGHRVTLVHPRNIVSRSGSLLTAESRAVLIDLIKRSLWAPRLRWRHRSSPVPWFPLDRQVDVKLVTDLRERFIPDGEVIVATAFQTAAPVAGYGRRKGRGYYLIQSFENWMGDEESVRASWRLPLQKIVISRWLERLAIELGEAERTTCIPLGLDFTRFRVTRPIEDRRTARVGMLAHPLPIKGTSDGVAALKTLRRKHPGIEAVLFGTESRERLVSNLPEWPEWIEYRHRPTAEELVDLYNSCQIFLHPSRLEGWGLPAAEAMACGCALVAAHNQGVDEFAIDGENALLAPVGDSSALAEQIERLLADEPLRQRIAGNGAFQIRRFDWERSVDRFEELLAHPDQRTDVMGGPAAGQDGAEGR